MPAVLYAILRPLIIWVTQVVVTTAIASFIGFFLKNLVEALARHYDIDENDSKIIIANEIIDIVLFLGVGTAVMSAKIGINTAKYLGFADGKLVKRVISPKATAKIKGKPKDAPVDTSFLKKVKSYVIGNTPTEILMRLMLLQQMGDWFFFKRQMVQDVVDSVFGKDTINLPGEKDAAPGFTQSEWDGFLSAIETAGIVGLNNPKAMQSQVYSREVFKTLMFWIYGEQVKIGGSTSASALQKAVQPYLIFTSPTTSTPAKVAAGIVVAPQVAQVRVFSGVVSQGVIGSTATFTPRPDDLIENAEELSQASHNNLAPFLAALPSRMSYEIKVVPSVKSASGFTQRGTVQRVVSGYNKDGSAKYRTVVNKFAIMDIFVKTDKGTQSKITTIVLGPVDSVRFQGANVNLGAVAVGVQQNITAPASVATPTVAPTTGATSGPTVPSKESGQNVPYLIYKFTPNGQPSYQALPATNTPYGASVADLTEARAWFAANPTALTQQHSIPNFDRILAGEFIDSGLSWGVDPVSKEAGWGYWKAIATPAVAPVATASVPTATSLFEYYKAHGQSLPSVEERSKLYEQLALGQAAYYTGTAEQNTKLLAALQGSRL